MTLVQKLQMIKEAKDEIVKTLSASYGVSAALSDVVQNVKKATKNVEDLSSIIDADLYEYYIDQNMADFLSVADYYPNGSVVSATYGNYMSYVYKADRDFDLWGVQSELSTPYSSQHLILTIYNLGQLPWTTNQGRRHRVQTSGAPVAGSGVGDSPYPTESNPAHISAGQYIVFSHDMLTNLTPKEQYRPFKWHTSIPMRYRGNIAGTLLAQYRNTPALSADSNLQSEYVRVFMPAEDGYVGWKIERFEKGSMNANCWHLGLTYLFDKDLTTDVLKQLTNNGEIEMAVKLNGRPDYIGCKAHGDEIMQSVSLSVNGTEVPIKSVANTTMCRSVAFRQTSKMYDPSLSLQLSDVTDETPYVAIHDKTLTFQGGTLSIDQTITWNDEFSVAETDFPMFTPRKYNTANGISVVITDGCYTNLSSYDLPHPWDQPSIPSQSSASSISSATVYGKESGIACRVTCSQFVNGDPATTGFSLRDNGGANYNKIYFNMSGSLGVKTANAGDVWTSHAEIKVMA